MGSREEAMQGPGKLWTREFAANGSDAKRTILQTFNFLHLLRLCPGLSSTFITTTVVKANMRLLFWCPIPPLPA